MTPKNDEIKISDVKKKIIISMCAIILLVLTIFGITYAYFTASVQGNKKDTSIEASAAILKLDYNGENSYIEVKGLLPGETIQSKKFSVKNTGTATISNYDIILENLVNELSRHQDLTYELTCTSSDGKDCIGSNGFFPKTNQVIATNTIDSGVKHSYVLKLTYQDTNTNQSIDMNKEISAKVNIKDDNSDIKTFKIYGNTLLSEVKTRSVTPQNDMQYLGDLVTDKSDNNYGKYRVPINLIGKNLFDIDSVKKMYNSSEVDITYYMNVMDGIYNNKYAMYNLGTYSPFNVKKLLPGTYTLSCEVSKVKTYHVYMSLKTTSENIKTEPANIGVNYSEKWKKISVVFTLDKETEIKGINLQESGDLSYRFNIESLFRNIQLEKNDTTTDYEKYNESNNYIYLDEPLRKIGDVADYIDLENKIVVRRVGEKVFDGTENIHNYENGVYYGLIHDYNVPAISNYYSNTTEEKIYFTSTINSNAIHFRVDENAEEFKALLVENYNNNKPLKILYALQNETFESISIPDFEINNTNTINVCDDKDMCASNIEVEFDE